MIIRCIAVLIIRAKKLITEREDADRPFGWRARCCGPEASPMPNPGSYSGVPDFTAGYLAAKKNLDPIDAQRKTDAGYKAGWNTFP